MHLSITSYAPEQTSLTIVDGSTSTPYRALKETGWGDAVWEHNYSGAVGTQGARPAQGKPQNRPVVLAIRVTGTSKDDLASNLSDLYAVIDECRRFGGRITWQSNSQTYRQHCEIMASTGETRDWGTRAENTYQTTITASFQCAPYLLGDPMWWFDDFSTDQLDEMYTTFIPNDADPQVFLVEDGVLKSAYPDGTTSIWLGHSGYGYGYHDVEITTKASLSDSGTGFHAAGAIFNAVEDSGSVYCLKVFVQNDYGTQTLEIETNWNDGPPGDSVSLTTPFVTGQQFWVVGRIEGSTAYAEYWTEEPTPMGTPDTSLSYDIVSFNLNVSDLLPFQPGVYLDTTTSTIDDDVVYEWGFHPYTYRDHTLPDNIRLFGSIPGDAPALADISVTPSGGSAAPAWALIGWARRPENFSWIWNGDFEEDVDGWVAYEDTTLSQSSAESYTGASSMLIEKTGAGDHGADFTVYHRFTPGYTYVVEMIVKGFTDIDNLDIETVDDTLAVSWLGSNEDSLDDGWVRMWASFYMEGESTESITFRIFAHLESNDYYIDSCAVYEAESLGTDGVLAIDDYDADAVPTLDTQIEGRGAQPPFGIIRSASCDTGDLSGWAITTDADYLGGSGLQITAAGAGTASASWFVDPNTLIPDDYARGEVDIEVYARVELDGDLVSPQLTLSAVPAKGTGYGAQRYTHEFGSAGRYLVEPSGSGQVFRVTRLGTLTFLVDRDTPVRWKLTLDAAYAASSAGVFGLDYLVLVPSRRRVLGPTAQVLDSGYPRFVSTTSETTKTIRSDLSGTVSYPGDGAHPDHGLGGSPIEIPVGENLNALVKLSSLVPDDPTSDTTTEQLSHDATVRFDVTPRYHHLRGT